MGAGLAPPARSSGRRETFLPPNPGKPVVGRPSFLHISLANKGQPVPPDGMFSPELALTKNGRPPSQGGLLSII